MKAFLYKAKGVLALTLAMSMFCPQVFAAEALSAAEQGVQESPDVEMTMDDIEADTLPVLTFTEALDKARKHSPDLMDLEDSLEVLEDSDESMYESYGSITIPGYEYKRWAANDGIYQLIAGAFNIEQGLKQAKLGRELQELVLEVTVRTYFTTIISIEDGLEMARANADMQQTTYEQGKVRHRLGMLSTYNLNQLETTAKKATDTVTTTEATLEQMYITFNNLIGENVNERFRFVYDVEYTPFEMVQTLNNYIDSAVEKDLSLQLQELQMEAAKFKANYRTYSDTHVTADSDKLSYTKAKRGLKTAKDEKKVLLRNTYLQIKSLETEYESAVADLNKAQADYRVAQLSYQTGAATKMAVEGAKMGVTNAENALQSIVYEHDMLVYKFKNPSILSNAAK